MFIMENVGYNYSKNMELLKTLIREGADVNLKDAEGIPVYGIAIQKQLKRKFEIISLLEEHGANSDFKIANGQNALMLAFMADNPDVVDYLITKGLDIYQEDQEGDSTLIYAAIAGYWDMAQKWIKEGAPDKQLKRFYALFRK